MRRYLEHFGVSVAEAPTPLPDFLRVALASKPVSRQRQMDAQDIYYASLDTSSYADFMEGLQRTLQQNPQHVDALLLRMEQLPRSKALIPAYERLLNLARQELGADFQHMNGGFWGFHETRPYMRARLAYANILARYKEHEAVIDHYLAMLDLNLSDNQGVRYQLLPLLMLKGDWEQFDNLIARFPDDAGAIWLWGQVLAAVIRGQHTEKIESLTAAAREINEHVPAMMRKAYIHVDEIASSYRFGSEEEAMIAAHYLRALLHLPQVQKWLA